MPRLFTGTFLLLILGLTSCVSEQYETRPFARVSASVWESMLLLGHGSVGYDSLGIGGGVSFVDEGGRKKSTREVMVLVSEFDDYEAIEIAAGGHYFFGDLESLRPYGGIHAVGVNFDEGSTQLGVRAGVGAEVPVWKSFFFDFGLDYLQPVVAATTDSVPEEDIEADGWSFRFGLGFDF